MIATREHVLSKKEDLQRFLNSHTLHKFYGGENAFLLDEYFAAMRIAGLKIEKFMAPLDSPINYFPMTSEQFFNHCAGPVTVILGQTFTHMIFNSRHRIGRGLMRMLVRVRNRLDQTPGRLYSFVATKPAFKMVV